ncbi:lysoplasmalogenase [Brumimicrobium salinarum]|nr:lysoplasmalogenase [Brumimicrobium salinarum]
MAITIGSLIITLSALMAIIFRQKNKKLMFAIFKPLTTILIIGLAFYIQNNTNEDYSYYMILALVFALMGDIFLLDKKFFIYGLTSFLIAHIIFIIGFVTLYGLSSPILPLLGLLVIGLLFFNYMRKSLGNLVIPVVVYILAILFMNWQAIGLLYHNQSLVFIFLGIGSLLFTFSDAILAIDMFKKPIQYAEILILSSYWSAIFIFTLAGNFIAI